MLDVRCWVLGFGLHSFFEEEEVPFVAVGIGESASEITIVTGRFGDDFSAGCFYFGGYFLDFLFGFGTDRDDYFVGLCRVGCLC